MVSSARLEAAEKQFLKDFLSDDTGVAEKAVLARNPPPSTVSGAAGAAALAKEVCLCLSSSCFVLKFLDRVLNFYRPVLLFRESRYGRSLFLTWVHLKHR